MGKGGVTRHASSIDSCVAKAPRKLQLCTKKRKLVKDTRTTGVGSGPEASPSRTVGERWRRGGRAAEWVPEGGVYLSFGGSWV
jgi:hypothetical protein